MFLFIKLDPIFKYCSTAFSSRISIPSLPFDLQIAITPVISRQFTIHSGPRCSILQILRVIYRQTASSTFSSSFIPSFLTVHVCLKVSPASALIIVIII